MESIYKFFNRDISWLSFNYRVLLEADDDRLPLYERINFIAIYSSNLEEFYKVRVAEHKAIASGSYSEDMSQDEAHSLIRAITKEVNLQLEDRVRIFEKKIIPALRKHHIHFYQSISQIDPRHTEYIGRYFREEIFPFLQPVPICKSLIKSFLRTNRLYLAIRLKRNETGVVDYFMIRLPYSKMPRFVELPKIGEEDYIVYVEDIIKMNLPMMFPGYEVESSYCFKVSRNADVYVDDVTTSEKIVEQLKKKVKKRKLGALCRFVYDRNMPADFLHYLADAFSVGSEELVPGDKHLNLEDLFQLPHPKVLDEHIPDKPKPMYLKCLEGKHGLSKYVSKQDLLLHFPYHSFDHFLDALYEAVHDPECKEIMLTQYRVAENSEVISTLIAAARNGKKVTVFVELKARFDEEHNLATAEMMKKAGVNIIYSMPGLKVHAKVALVLRYNEAGEQIKSFAYVSTGNFNEQTARVYADCGLFTCNEEIVNDLHTLFKVLRREEEHPEFQQLLVAQFNLLDGLKERIAYEINEAKQGRKGRIVLKMNALQDPAMISELYKASEAGVKIDLIVRGICCLIPNQTYSKNIRVTRIVDSFLEHARVWYFYHGGEEQIFLGSPDWMKRNLYRRIEAVTPILDVRMKKELVDMLHIQLRDNQKAGWVDENLRNVFKMDEKAEPVRSQYAFYEYLKEKNL